MKSFKIDEIEIYQLQFSSYLGEEDQFLKDLSLDELSRYERYRFPDDKHRFIICRAMLRRLLAERTNEHPGKIIFEYSKYGKPTVKTVSTEKFYHFNVSHSGDYGLIALSQKYEVGIDIEQHKELSDRDGIMEHQFSKDELNMYKSSQNKQHFFFDLWSQKEAIVKASGEGLSMSLKHWSIDPNCNDYSISIKNRAFNIQKLDLAANYSAAISQKRNKNLILGH